MQTCYVLFPPLVTGGVIVSDNAVCDGYKHGRTADLHARSSHSQGSDSSAAMVAKCG